jgi:hypothetical protein
MPRLLCFCPANGSLLRTNRAAYPPLGQCWPRFPLPVRIFCGWSGWVIALTTLLEIEPFLKMQKCDQFAGFGSHSARWYWEVITGKDVIKRPSRRVALEGLRFQSEVNSILRQRFATKPHEASELLSQRLLLCAATVMHLGRLSAAPEYDEYRQKVQCRLVPYIW